MEWHWFLLVGVCCNKKNLFKVHEKYTLTHDDCLLLPAKTTTTTTLTSNKLKENKKLHDVNWYKY
jgi:hypothetical protein